MGVLDRATSASGLSSTATSARTCLEAETQFDVHQHTCPVCGTDDGRPSASVTAVGSDGRSAFDRPPARRPRDSPGLPEATDARPRPRDPWADSRPDFPPLAV